MQVKYTVNNYVLGAKVRTTPVDKILSRNRVDKYHTEIIYELDSQREKEFCDKILQYKGSVI